MDCTIVIDPLASPVDVILPLDDVVIEPKDADGIIVEEIQLPQTTTTTTTIQTISPLESILSSSRIKFPNSSKAANIPSQIRQCISSLDSLIIHLSSLDYISLHMGSSPGFDTGNSSTLEWRDVLNFSQYETYDLSGLEGKSVPTPCAEVVCGYFRLVRDAWVERLDWAERRQSSSASAGAGNEDKATRDGNDEACSCIASWEHFGGIVLSSLVNQVVEQLMIREASDCLRDNLELCRVWNTELYAPDSCPSLESMKGLYLDGNVHLFSGLEDYLREYIEAALRCKSTIDVCTCYLFRTEVSTRYILLDLLPYLAQHCGVKVRVLFEAMTLESQILHTAFDDGTLNQTSCMEGYASFIESLPDGSPPFDRAAKKYLGASDLVRDFMEIASHTGNIEVRFWMARDKRMKYRVKNHTKCNIFDGATVIAGGSNLVPRGGSRDTDLLMTGAVASMYQLDFENMWRAMGAGVSDVMPEEEKKEVDMSYCTDAILAPENHNRDSAPKLGHESKIFFLASQPSSIGEDVILRCILGAIHDAKESIYICMGHFNVPVPAAEALRSATERGVKVRVLANSLYSCDLRGGQRDLFISLMNMLAIAPKIELFVTTVKNGKKPHFLHSKYIVVDSEFSAVGSYNMWTRSAFYEKESEVFIYSKDFAAELIDKFDKENEEYCIKVESVEECKHFLPKGCSLCKGFGPFYDC